MDQRIEKWTRWIGGQIQNEIIVMNLRRDTWDQVQAVITENGRLPDSYWWEFMRDTYASTQAMAIRRQVFADRDAASLGKLISEISEDTSGLTQAMWLGMWDLSDTDDRYKELHATQAWRKQFDPGGVGHLDPAIAVADLIDLRDTSMRVTDYVDRHVAHSDRRPLPADDLPTLNEVHDAVDKLSFLYKRYYNLLTASSWAFLVPVIQHDWKAVFREPWIRASE